MKKVAGLAAVAAATVGMLTTSAVYAHGIWFAQQGRQSRALRHAVFRAPART